MLLRRIESEGLAHNSYYVADGGEAVVIDPRRDVDVYLEIARRNGDRIRHVLETHRQEDFVLGSTALSAVAGADVLHGRGIDFEYGASVQEGDEVGVGRLRFRVLETPGHTDESVTYVMVDTQTSGEPIQVFTGDALFAGATGRTDLYGPAEARRLAESLYESLFGGILPLGDHLLVYPSHGSGSACGSGIADRNPSSIGIERLYNDSLAHTDKESFVSAKLGEGHLRPPYFERMAEWNRRGDAPVYERMPDPPALTPSELADRIGAGAIVVDARMPQAFAGGHIPGSYNIWFDGLASYLGWAVPYGSGLVFVLPEHVDVQALMRTVLRIGYDDVIGYLRGGFEAWQNEGREVERHGTITTPELQQRLDSAEQLEVIDVRKPDEVQAGTIDRANPIFVGELEERVQDLPRDSTIVTMCSVGHRGGLAASILARHGFHRVHNYLGGYTAWKQRRTR